MYNNNNNNNNTIDEILSVKTLYLKTAGFMKKIFTQVNIVHDFENYLFQI